MDIEKMVDELIEKRLNDYVESELSAGEWRKENIQQALVNIIAKKVEEKIKAQKPELMKKAKKYLDRCEVKADFGGFNGLRVTIVDPEEK